MPKNRFCMNIFEQTAQFCKKGLDLDCTFLNDNYHVQAPYDQRFSPNTNVTLVVAKLSIVDSIFNMNRPSGCSGRPPFCFSYAKTIFASDTL